MGITKYGLGIFSIESPRTASILMKSASLPLSSVALVMWLRIRGLTVRTVQYSRFMYDYVPDYELLMVPEMYLD